jgi:hypothetical protein
VKPEIGAEDAAKLRMSTTTTRRKKKTAAPTPDKAGIVEHNVGHRLILGLKGRDRRLQLWGRPKALYSRLTVTALRV